MSNKAQKTADEFITKYGLISIRMSVEQLFDEGKIPLYRYTGTIEKLNRAEDLRIHFLEATAEIDRELEVINKEIRKEAKK